MRNRWYPKWRGHEITWELYTLTLSNKKEVEAVKVTFPDYRGLDPFFLDNTNKRGMTMLRHGGWPNLPHKIINESEIVTLSKN